MVRFSNGLELDASFARSCELEGHHRGFKVLTYSGALPDGARALMVNLTSYAENYFDVRIVADNQLDQSYVQSLLDDQVLSNKEKLERMTTFALSKLSDKEVLKVFGLMYKAGKASGKNEVRKRIHQLLRVQ